MQSRAFVEPDISVQVLDPDCLRVYEGMSAEVREFTAVPAVLYSTYRYTWIGRGHAIDENTARVKIASDLARFLYIAGPDVSAQSELAAFAA